MSRLFLTLLAILAIFSASVSSSRPICPQNEEWDDCSTACPLTCKDPNPRPCTLQCIQGCKCSDGLLRSGSGKCIPRSEC